MAGLPCWRGRLSGARGRPWGRELYRRGGAGERVPVAIRMIPYFAWHKRGNQPMAVWLPLA